MEISRFSSDDDKFVHVRYQVAIGIGLEKKLKSLKNYDTTLKMTGFNNWRFIINYPEYEVVTGDGTKIKKLFSSPPKSTTSDQINLEIKVDTDNGKLWFGDGKFYGKEKKREWKFVGSDLLEYAGKNESKNEGFTFCCSVWTGVCIRIVDCVKLTLQNSQK